MQIESTLPIMLKPLFAHDSRNDPARRENSTQATLTPSVQAPEVDENISKLAEAIQPFDIALKFSKDHETGAIVIEMIDQTTGETLQQIPNAAMLRVSAVLGKLQGQIFNETA
jgi:uncharacterized FlaG/YvyC family protein